MLYIVQHQLIKGMFVMSRKRQDYWMKRNVFKKYASVNKITVLNRIGEFWKKEELRKLTNRFERHVPVDMMCRFHRRDVGGIMSRLVTLGLIKPEGWNKRYVHTELSPMSGTFMSFSEVNDIRTRVESWIKMKVSNVTKAKKMRIAQHPDQPDNVEYSMTEPNSGSTYLYSNTHDGDDIYVEWKEYICIEVDY